MRIGMPLSYSGGFTEAVAELADYEQAGLDIVFVREAYSFDAVSQLGFLAARTARLELAAGILPIYTRTPTLTAMTAASGPRSGRRTSSSPPRSPRAGSRCSSTQSGRPRSSARRWPPGRPGATRSSGRSTSSSARRWRSGTTPTTGWS